MVTNPQKEGCNVKMGPRCLKLSVCALIFFDYSPSGYSNIIVFTPTEIKIAQNIVVVIIHIILNRNALNCTNFNFGCVFTNK